MPGPASGLCHHARLARTMGLATREATGIAATAKQLTMPGQSAMQLQGM